MSWFVISQLRTFVVTLQEISVRNAYTVEPRFDELLYNEVLGTTNDIF